MRELLAFSLLLLCFPLIASTQGSLGKTSSGSFSITLVIPPRITPREIPESLQLAPTSKESATHLCVTGTGINQYSTSVLPPRIPSERPATVPLLNRADGQIISLNEAPKSYTSHNPSDCPREFLSLPSSTPVVEQLNNQATASPTKNNQRPITILLAPE